MSTPPTKVVTSGADTDAVLPSWRPYGALVVLLLVPFGIAHAAGLREHTSALSGTSPGGPDAELAGFAYLALQLGAVGVAPILLIAGALVCATAAVLRARR